MKCYKCNSEVNANSNFCEKCGAPIKVNRMSKRKKVTICSFAILLLAVTATFIGIKMYIERKPSEKQVKKDLKNEVLSGYKNADISKFSVEREDKVNREYSIRVGVTFSSNDIEYEQKYTLIYKKDSKWKLVNYDFGASDEWKKKPLKAPDIETVLEDVKEKLDYSTTFKFTKITESEKQESPDLDEGIAYYCYDVEEESELRNVKGKIKVEYVFDNYSDTWEYADYEITDEDVELDIIGTWKGKAYVKYYGDDEKYKGFKLTITQVDGEEVQAEVRKSTTTYKASGSIDPSSLSLTLEGIDNPDVCLSGAFDYETGDFKGTFNKEYDYNDIYYYGDCEYDVTLKREK